ncbi:MAG: protein translocase subunit SecD [Candidatus Hydrogenedentales bacterium]|jgi:SecD/SecF fusion protein
MKRHLYRTLLVYGVLLLGLIYVYPTIGWMTLTDEQRTARIAAWDKEDSALVKRGYWATVWHKTQRWAQFDRDWVMNLGLDLQGGIQMVVGLDYDALDPKVKADLIERGMNEENIREEMQRQVLQRIERRIRGFGAREPIIQTMGTEQIQVQLPGERDIDRARELIFKTAFLTFQIVAGEEQMVEVFGNIDKHFNNDFVPRLERSVLREEQGLLAVKEGQFEYVSDLVKKAAAVPGLIPENRVIAFGKDPKKHFIYLLDKEPLMTGDGLSMANARPDEDTGGSRWMITFGLKPSAASDFGERTAANIDRSMAIVVDDVVESAPGIRDRITTNGQITGNFSQEEAVDLAIALNSGSLPVPIREDQTGFVGPRLGADAIRMGVFSSLISLLIVCAAMIVYYRMAGVVANIALVMNALLLLACMAYFQATLTLPGIAGVILTIGMAVDANVLIYERMREELRNGKSLLACIDGGYAHAMSAIVDSNVTTLIAGVVLMQFGSGPIQGFAITLSIGILSSMFTSLIVTRAVFDFMTAKKWFTKINFMQAIKPDTKIPFMDWRKPFMIASIVTIVFSIGLYLARGDRMYGVDFTTGTNMILSLNSDNPIEVGAVRNTLSKAGFVEPTVTDYEQVGVESRNRFMVHLGEVSEGAAVGTQTEENSVATRVKSTLTELAGTADKVDIEKVDMVGPTVGRQLKLDAFKAIAWSFFFLIIYLWFRFELKFSVAAMVTLFHDVAIVLGLFAITGRQVSLGVIAGLLTVIGYSLNDTIIVFDRVREDLKLHRGRGTSILDLMNRSVNLTLSRTILTSMCTLFVVFVLLIWGGETINDFAFALTCGIVAGTYSSIFIACPIVHYWQLAAGRWDKRKTTGTDDNTPSRYRRKSPKPGTNVEDEASAT